MYFGCAARVILVSQSGIESMLPVLKAQSLNLWTSREVPCVLFFFFLYNHQLVLQHV